MSLPQPETPPAGYRPGVGILLFNRTGLVFVAQRRDTPGEAWQMPQGGIDSGEEPRQAALRELEEETGTAKAEIVAETGGWLLYDLPPDLAGKMWGGRYRGQAQKWFAARFLGTDGDIDIHKHDHPEFSAWKWAPLDSLPALIVGFKRALYTEIVAALGPAVKAAVG
ncbi:MAG: RNA pyrophosphohydrolase [Rhodospirillaceae bacterium]|nr:RNA pyrophosphohydrolase [Rhodospirillaceae bacterium]